MKRLQSLMLLLLVTATAVQAESKRWDFTQWSATTIANLKAEAAKSEVKDLGDGKTQLVDDHGALWSDHEKGVGKDCTSYGNSKDGKCFWATSNNNEGGDALKANGEIIPEIAGLYFNKSYTANRSLAIAVDYNISGDYHGASYLWFGAKEKDICVIRSVRPGATIKMGVESHKIAEARGVELYLVKDATILTHGTQLKSPDGTDVAVPTTYQDLEWQMPNEDALTEADKEMANGDGTYNVLIYNTNGCHIYYIEVSDIVEQPVTFKAKNEQDINIQYRIVSEEDKTCEVYAEPFRQGVTFNAAVAKKTTGNVIIPAEANGYKVIGISSWAFYSCKNITSMELPETVGYIGESAFRMATGLQYINLPVGMTEMADYCFSGATHLQEITIPEGVITIGYHAFANNYMLQSVTIPSTVNAIAATAFQHPRMLKKLVVNITTPIELPSGNFESDYRAKTVLYVPAASVEAYRTSEDWQGFKEVDGFYENGDVFTATNEQGIDIQYIVTDNQDMTCTTYAEPYEEGKEFRPAIDQNTAGEQANGYRVTAIGGWSFRECQQLTSVQLPAGITSIGSSAFRMDKSLTSINIPEGVVSIGDNAFRGNRMDIIVLPSTLESIGDNCFIYISSTGIEQQGSCHFIANMEQPCALGSDAIRYKEYYDLYVPKGSLEAYQNDDAWQGFRSIQEIGGSKVEDQLTVADMTVKAGEEADVDIFLTTAVQDYKGYQMSLSLPEGIAVATNDKGTCRIVTGPDNQGFTITARQQGNGSYQILAYSMDGDNVKGGNNFLLRIPVTTDKALAAGTYTARIENILFAGIEASANLQNVAFGMTVEAATPEVRIIYADNVETEAGQTVVMPIMLNTEKAVDGLECTVSLPKGVTMLTADMNGEYAEDFTLKCTQKGNAYKLLAFSMTGESLPAKAGDVIDLKLQVAANTQGGVYAAVLSDIMLAYADESDEYPEAASSTITVKESTPEYTPGDVNNDGNINVRDVIMVVDYILGNEPNGFVFEAADMNGSGDINVRDIIIIIDIILNEQ